MNKIFTYKISENDALSLSNTISEFIDCIEDKCDGAFTLVYKNKGKLGCVSLCVFSTDNELLQSINGKTIESDICKIRVIGISSLCLLGRNSEYPVESMLKSGKVIYDKYGTLRVIQSNFESDKNIDLLDNRSLVRTKPPIQYVKKSN